MTINTGAIAKLLSPGLAAVFGSYPMYPSQWKEIYTSYDSDKAVEVEVEMRMLGLAQLRAEGAPTAMDTMGQRIVTNYLHRTFSLGFTITRQALVDNLYKTRFPMMAKALRDSMAQTKEVVAAAVMNNAFLTAFPIGDGKPLCSTTHPIDGGTFSNTPGVNTDLNEASLEAAIIAIQQFKNQAGLIIQTKPKKLVVPPSNQFIAERLLSSAFRTSTANNDVSAIYNISAIPEGYTVNNFITLNSWFILTSSPDGFKHYMREPISTDVYTDDSTDNVRCKAVERYSFGVSNPRAVYGSQA